MTDNSSSSSSTPAGAVLAAWEHLADLANTDDRDQLHRACRRTVHTLNTHETASLLAALILTHRDLVVSLKAAATNTD